MKSYLDYFVFGFLATSGAFWALLCVEIGRALGTWWFGY